MSMSRPKKNATPTPTRPGWLTPQKTKTTANTSGRQAALPQTDTFKNMFKAKAPTKLKAMNKGLAGNKTC
jgi:hypothetical protein